MSNEFKTLSQWVNDPRCPLKKMQLWKAIQANNLRATRPLGGKMWVIKWIDLEAYLNGQG